MRTRFCENKDSWGKGFRKTSANIFLNSAGLHSPAGGVWGGMRETQNKNPKNTLSRAGGIFLLPWLLKVKVHPRHPPRAFPLGLRVPRCL